MQNWYEKYSHKNFKELFLRVELKYTFTKTIKNIQVISYRKNRETENDYKYLSLLTVSLWKSRQIFINDSLKW